MPPIVRAQTIIERAGDGRTDQKELQEQFPDLSYVLLKVRLSTLQDWNEAQGLSRGENQAEAVDVASRQSRPAALRALYSTYRYGGYAVAATWFRGIEPPVKEAENILPKVGEGWHDSGYARVWRAGDAEAEVVDGIRLAYREGSGLVREALGVRPVQRYGVVTLLWRDLVDAKETVQKVLELHANRQQLPSVVGSLLPALGSKTADAEVLDIRSDGSISKLEAALGAELVNAKVSHDEPQTTLDHASFAAKLGATLSHPDSPYVRDGWTKRPGMGKALRCTLRGKMLTFTVSQGKGNFSVVMNPMDLSRSAAFFKEGTGVGAWTRFYSK